MDFTQNLANNGIMAVNVIGTLVLLTGASSLLYAFLKIIFDLPAYNTLFGKGALQPDGTYDWQSKYFPNCDPRPYVAAAIGVLAAFLFGLQAFAGVLSLDIAKMSAESIFFDQISTGIIISSGCKGVIYFVEEYTKSKKAIKSLEG